MKQTPVSTILQYVLEKVKLTILMRIRVEYDTLKAEKVRSGSGRTFGFQGFLLLHIVRGWSWISPGFLGSRYATFSETTVRKSVGKNTRASRRCRFVIIFNPWRCASAKQRPRRRLDQRLARSRVHVAEVPLLPDPDNRHSLAIS